MPDSSFWSLAPKIISQEWCILLRKILCCKMEGNCSSFSGLSLTVQERHRDWPKSHWNKRRSFRLTSLGFGSPTRENWFAEKCTKSQGRGSFNDFPSRFWEGVKHTWNNDGVCPSVVLVWEDFHPLHSLHKGQMSTRDAAFRFLLAGLHPH